MAIDTEQEYNPGFSRPARRSPGADTRNPRSENIIQGRKRSLPRPSISPHNKRRKSRRLPLAEAQTDNETELNSDAEDESDGVPDTRKVINLQSMEICKVFEEYYSQAFRSIGQLALKELAKAWIRACHARKQTANPYNGGPTRRKSLRLYHFEGFLTAPDYWPRQQGWETGEGCRHKEPDHIKRAERVILLRHLLCCGNPRFSLDKLRAATSKIERDVQLPFTKRNIAILNEIYNIREVEMRYENQEIDGDTIVQVSMLKPPEKKQRIPKAPTSMRGRRKWSQQGSLYPTTQRVPVANMGSDVQPKEECSSAPIDYALTPHPISGIKGTTMPSPASSMSGAASFDSFTPINSQALRTKLSRPTSPPQIWFQNDSNVRSNNAYPYFEKVHDHRTATDLNANISAVHHQQASKGQAARTYTGASATTRRSPSGLSGVDPHVPLVGKSDGIGDITIRQGYHQIKSAQHAHYSVKSPDTSTSAVNPSRQIPAPIPMTFSGSSSGLAGLPSDQSWVDTSDPWAYHRYSFGGSALNESDDPGSLDLSYPLDVNPSASYDPRDMYLGVGGGLPPDNRAEPFQPFPLSIEQAFDADLQQQYETLLSSNFNSMSVVPPHQDMSNTLQIDNSSALENKRARVGYHNEHSRS